MKKKILSLALVIALFAIMVGGTLAYFSAEDEVTNTFTVGSVKIDIYENGEATDEAEKPFGSLTPIVNTTTPSEDVSYQDKVVKVKNTGLNGAYVRTHIAVPNALVNYLQLDLDTAGWVQQPTTHATVDGMLYNVYTYDYLSEVAPGEFTTELLKGAYLASNVDLQEDADGNLEFILRDNAGKVTHTSGFDAHTKTAAGYESAKVNILVASQAIQAQGFDNATVALNSGFAANPWAA